MTAAPDPGFGRTGASADFAARELDVTYPCFPECLPEGEIVAGKYRVRFARSVADLDAVEQLRFEVFNLELGEGLEASFDTGRDHDELDPYFHHLMIQYADSGEVVGTYRMQAAAMAAARQGWYSAGEFDLSLLPVEFIEQAVEVGRACVARGHRNGRVLNLLWRGLALYLAQNRKRFLFGCCSLTSQEAALGQATLIQLQGEGRQHPKLLAPPLPGLGCEDADPELVRQQTVHIPPLFQSYLNLGARICGPPAIDRLFKTIDFLVVLDVGELDAHSYRFFFREQ